MKRSHWEKCTCTLSRTPYGLFERCAECGFLWRIDAAWDRVYGLTSANLWAIIKPGPDRVGTRTRAPE